MSVDKRSVKTDALETLGSIIDSNQKRDAIHIAVEPVIAGERLRPGEDVGFIDGEAIGGHDNPVGIVDPFLKSAVQKGERFWLLVYPRQITSLRHVWTHPAFEQAEAKKTDPRADSEAWLRAFVAKSDCPSYEEVIAKAINQSDSWDDDYLHFVDSDAHGEIPPEFWTHVEIVTGQAILNRPSYFSCSC